MAIVGLGSTIAAFQAPAGAAFLPTRTDSKQLTIGEGQSRIDLLPFGSGHTSGDTVIVFPALRAAHMGDMLPWKDGFMCDRNNGGSCLATRR